MKKYGLGLWGLLCVGIWQSVLSAQDAPLSPVSLADTAIHALPSTQAAVERPEISADSQARYNLRMWERLSDIDTRTLFRLAQSDCFLSDIESECYVHYQLHRYPMPTEMAALLELKRQQIDYKRSYIDSLYYLQALQALNGRVPDWDLAERSLERALVHNRYFVRAVMFRWVQLQRRAAQTGVWDTCLDYASATLPPLGWHPKIHALGNELYIKILDAIDRMMDDGLYQDALSLFDRMKACFRPEYELYYMPHREQNQLYTAYQGIFISYYVVAEKAYARGLYRQAQKQALAAYDYYVRNEVYMSGVNASLSLLERILTDYRRFMAYADADEKAYYEAMAAVITEKTGLDLPPLSDGVIYDMADELRLAEAASALAEAEWAAEQALLTAPVLSPGGSVRTEALGASLPTGPETGHDGTGSIQRAVSAPEPPLASAEEQTAPHSATAVHAPAQTPASSFKAHKWSLPYAQKQWEFYVEQARLFRAKRQFIKAADAYAMADSVHRYYAVRVPSDYRNDVADNDLLCTEQLLNKAQYRLWQNDMDKADSLYRQALAIVGRTAPEARNPFYSLMEAFDEQKAKLLCRQSQNRWEQLVREVNRQLAVGQVEAVAKTIEDLDRLQAEDRQRPQACLSDTSALAVCRLRWRHLGVYRQLMDSAAGLLAASDSIGFVRCRLSADRYFEQAGMGVYVQGNATLFGDLSYERNFPLLVTYMQVCVEDGREAEVDFIWSYLKSYNYSMPLLDQLRKKAKKHNRN